MNPKQLLILLASAAILGGAYLLVNRQKSKPGTPAEVGKPLLANVDFDAITRVTIAGGGRQLDIAFDNGAWRVPTLANYPADPARLIPRLRALAGVKVSDVLRGMTLEPATTLTLRGEGKDLATLHIGQARQKNGDGAMMWRQPEGRYLRVEGSDKIYVVKEDLGEFTAEPRAWVDTQILAVPAGDVSRIIIENGEESFSFDRSSGTLVMESLAENETFDTSKIWTLESAFARLNFSNVFSTDLDDAITGLSTGVVFRVNQTSGATIAATIGNTAPDGGRYFKYTTSESTGGVDAEGGEWSGSIDTPTPYIFTIPAHVAENMTRPRDYFIKPADAPSVIVSEPVFIDASEETPEETEDSD